MPTRHQEFLAFLAPIDASVPAQLAVHLVLDNYATNEHPTVCPWLAARIAQAARCLMIRDCR